MATKVVVTDFLPTSGGGGSIPFEAAFVNTSTNLAIESYNDFIEFGNELVNYTSAEIYNGVETKILARATALSLSITAADIIYIPAGGFTKSGIASLAATASGRSFANPGRSLNGSAFQISSTRDAVVSYSVDVACTLSLTSGQQGTVYLRYADDSGFSTNITEVCRFVNGNTGTLTIGLNLTQNATGTLSGVIPAGKYVKLVTENNTGSPTFTYRRAQEVLL